MLLSGVTATAAAAPVVNNLGPDVTLTEGSSPTLVAPTATVSDADSPHFGGGRLTVSLANAQSTDQLLIRNLGPGPGQIGLSGNRVLYGGSVIGTVSGGRGSSPLVVSLNRNATQGAVQALVRNVGFANPSEDPSSQTRVITFKLQDGSGQVSAPASKSIFVVPVNDAPVLSGLGNTVNWSESTGAAVVISPNAQASDVDSSNFDGGTLTVTVAGNAGPGDVLEVRNQGTQAGQIGVAGNVVTYGGVAIGVVTGAGTSSLSVALNSAATPAAVSALMKNITFDNTDTNPSSLTRRVDFQLSDGDGGTSSVQSSCVAIAAVNDAPVVSNFGPSVSYQRGSTPAFLSTTATVTDADSTNFAGGRLTVQITANAQGSDGFAIFSEGFGPGQLGLSGNQVYYGGVLFGSLSGGAGTTPLVASFNQNATPAAVQALIRNIGFYTSPYASTATRQISLTLSDGDGGTSSAVVKNIVLT
ncbi:hypothetical protein AYO47_02970 [Planctomyces sp. SCGC AG-212-M04]|nr:hypothetical protein AYO47_02970 [Planctomyces sp. SCGC AG-212-M04]